MTQEDKQIVLVDLYARLPYGVKGLALGSKEDTISSLRLGEYPCVKTTSGLSCHLGTGQFKPYLRSMSSMTDEEKKEYYTFQYKFTLQAHEYQELNKETFSEYLDWLNKKMFDYRGLIPKGLALEAPEGMYL